MLFSIFIFVFGLVVGFLIGYMKNRNALGSSGRPYNTVLRVGSNGTPIVNREALHNSPAYKRQVAALDDLAKNRNKYLQRDRFGW